jgi:3-phenylpropionate/trans-cinnamate dioxygenase ferredoxin reductase component
MPVGYAALMVVKARPKGSTDRVRATPKASTRHPREIVIVGAGDCGTRAALAVRQLGYDGRLVLIGTESHEPYERPPLSKHVLQRSNSPAVVASDSAMKTADIEWKTGVTATAIDRRHNELETDQGERISYDRLLLATGARARRPAVPGNGFVHTLRSLDDAFALRSRLGSGTRLLVVGGGFVGLEVASIAATLGCSVTVLEFAHRLMSRIVPTKAAETVLQRHLSAGVDVRCGVSVNRLLEQAGGSVVAQLTDGGTITADVVIAGVGAIPNTELAASILACRRKTLKFSQPVTVARFRTPCTVTNGFALKRGEVLSITQRSPPPT